MRNVKISSIGPIAFCVLFSIFEVHALSASPKTKQQTQIQTLKVELPDDLAEGATQISSENAQSARSKKSLIETSYVALSLEQFDQMKLKSSTPQTISFRNDSLPGVSLGILTKSLTQYGGLEFRALASLEFQSHLAKEELTVAGRTLEDSINLYSQSALLGVESSKGFRNSQKISLQGSIGPSIAFSNKGLRSSAMNHYGWQSKINLRWKFNFYSSAIFAESFFRIAKLDEASSTGFGLGLGAQF